MYFWVNLGFHDSERPQKPQKVDDIDEPFICTINYPSTSSKAAKTDAEDKHNVL